MLSLLLLLILASPLSAVVVHFDKTSRGETGDLIVENRADPQTSLTLDPSVIAHGFSQDGQNGSDVAPGQVPSLTSTNNFINFCIGKTITDGKQVKEGSCNPAPVGDIPSVDNIPSTKILFPFNGDTATIKANTGFAVKLNVRNFETGYFTNSQISFYSAPQQVSSQGRIQGHSHIVIERLSSLNSTEAPDPKQFAFFKGINSPSSTNDVLTANVTDGLPQGAYRVCSVSTASNHQPVVAPVAQHGSIDDCSYFGVELSVTSPTGGTSNNGATILGVGAFLFKVILTSISCVVLRDFL